MGSSHNNRPATTGLNANLLRKATRLFWGMKDRIRNAGFGAAHARPDNGADEDMLAHFSSLLDSVTTGIISLDGEGNVRVFNASAESLFSLQRSQLIGRPFSEIGRMLAGSTHSCRALWERLSDAIWAAGAALDLECDLVQKNGTRLIICYSVYPLGRTAWSVGKGVVIMLEDVTRKNEIEDQVSDARKRLLAVFDGITDGIQVVDPDFRITSVNKSMKVLLGRPQIKIGALCYEASMTEGCKCVACPGEETFKTGQPATIMKKLLRQDGYGFDERERYVEISTFPVLDRGSRVIQVVEYIKDVTEKVKLAERLEDSRRLAELGEMAARVAHEVRNPLNAITGAAHFLSYEYTGDETLQKFTSLIKRQATRLNQVASDLLYVSKPMRTQFTSINLNAVLDQSLDSLCEQLREQKINVTFDCAPDLPQIEADEFQLEQVFNNLMRNAIEAMPRGGALRIGTGRIESSRVEIRIEDSGQGIPEKDRERIFQSFFTTKVKGTGLGLSIVQRVLKNHNGEILIEQPGAGGTRCVVRLPINSGSGMHSSNQASE